MVWKNICVFKWAGKNKSTENDLKFPVLILYSCYFPVSSSACFFQSFDCPVWPWTDLTRFGLQYDSDFSFFWMFHYFYIFIVLWLFLSFCPFWFNVTVYNSVCNICICLLFFLLIRCHMIASLICSNPWAFEWWHPPILVDFHLNWVKEKEKKNKSTQIRLCKGYRDASKTNQSYIHSERGV